MKTNESVVVPTRDARTQEAEAGESTSVAIAINRCKLTVVSIDYSSSLREFSVVEMAEGREVRGRTYEGRKSRGDSGAREKEEGNGEGGGMWGTEQTGLE